jgi:Zn-dependent protease
MIVIPGRIPVAIHPFFWLMAALIGWMNSNTIMGSLVWVGIILVSVLIHEFGHALTAVAFRQKANIQLVALGGLTSYEGPKLKFWQQFLIVLNGPLFGFGLFLVATALLQLDWSQTPILFNILRATQLANLFWTIVNLLPVLPLDGGQLLRIVMEAWLGTKGYLASLLIGAVLSTLFGLYFFLVQAFLIGALFFLFAFQSFDLWRKSRNVTLQDRDEDVKKLLLEGEKALGEGRRSDAEKCFQEIRSKTDRGLLYMAATQYLAFLDMQLGKKEDAYQLLLPIETHLADESICLLHQLAAEHANWNLVAKLSAECYQLTENQDTALRNARAFANLHQAKPAGGWLQTAYQFGGIDLEKVLREESFQAIKQDPDFKNFMDQMK